MPMTWEHLKAKYEPKDAKAYLDLEVKFVQWELELPRENPGSGLMN